MITEKVYLIDEVASYMTQFPEMVEQFVKSGKVVLLTECGRGSDGFAKIGKFSFGDGYSVVAQVCASLHGGDAWLQMDWYNARGERVREGEKCGETVEGAYELREHGVVTHRLEIEVQKKQDMMETLKTEWMKVADKKKEISGEWLTIGEKYREVSGEWTKIAEAWREIDREKKRIGME